MQLGSQHEIRILHVDDDPSITDLTGTFLEREDDRFAVETATSAEEGMEKLCDSPPDCVVSDYNMPGMDGLAFLRAVREEYPDLPFILFTGKGSEAVASEAIAADVTDYLQKGSGAETYELLANRIRNAVRARRETTRAERQEQLMRLTEFAGNTGGFELDVASGEVLLTDGARRMLDAPEQATYDFENGLQDFHPDDRENIRQTIQRALQTGEQTHGTWRYQHTDGEEKLLDVTYTPVTTNGETATIRGAIHDITDRRERQRELRLLQQAIDDANVSITLADPSQPDAPLVYVNDAFEEMTGYPPEEMLGRNCRFLQGEDTDPEKVATLREAIDNEEPISVELRNYRNDGTEFWNRLTVTPVYDGDGQLVRYLGTQEDVTERRERERELHEVLERYEALFRNTNDAIARVEYEDSVPIIQEANDAFRELFEPPGEDVVGQDLDEVVASEKRFEAAREYSRTTSDGQFMSAELTRDTVDGPRDFRWQAVPLDDSNDSEEGLDAYAVYTDITERKKHERELRRLKEEYESVFDNVQDSLFLWDVAGSEADPEFRLRRVNPANASLTGVSPGEVLNKTPTEVFSEEVASQFFANYERCLERGESISYEERLDVGEGQRIYETTLTPVEIDGEIAQIAGAAHDITARKERERELKRERDRLDQFASIVSHDLRSPLNVASTCLELASEECESTLLVDAAGALDRMETLIDDLLTIAQDGTPVQETEIVTLPKIVEDCWSVVETGEATLRTSGEQSIRADPGRLKQLLENLFRNAIEHGGDDVTVTVGEIADGFYVADDGTGIPAEEREAVFEMGYSTADSGTGFGLNIVKEIVDAHEWEISVTDSDDGGVRFEIAGVETT